MNRQHRLRPVPQYRPLREDRAPGLGWWLMVLWVVVLTLLALIVRDARFDRYEPEIAPPGQINAYTPSDIHGPKAATRSATRTSAAAYDPKTDPWYMQIKRHHRTACIEYSDSAAPWPWLRVATEYNRAHGIVTGLNLFVRSAGGCASVPSGQRIIIKTYAFYNGDKSNMWSEACALTLPWTLAIPDQARIDYTEIWINLTRATAGHIACRTGMAFPSVAFHEVGHALGLGHTTYTPSTMNGDYGSVQWVDSYRLRYLYKGVAL